MRMPYLFHYVMHCYVIIYSLNFDTSMMFHCIRFMRIHIILIKVSFYGINSIYCSIAAAPSHFVVMYRHKAGYEKKNCKVYICTLSALYKYMLVHQKLCI